MKRPPTSVLSLAGSGETSTIDEDLRRRYLKLLDRHGYVYVTDVPDGFEYEKFLTAFGEPFPGPFGRTVDDIVPEAGMDDVYYAGNRKALLPHTEGYEREGLPPRYLVLWCVTPPTPHEGGETTLYDAAPLLSALPPETERRLRETRYEWRAGEGLARLGRARRATHPVLAAVDGTTVLRVSCNNMTIPAADDPVHGFLADVRRRFAAECVSIDYRRNDFVHWDNWRILHSRNAFRGATRHLRRMQISHADARASA
ncbi:TauD/TfdA family dioxygenase [Streptomyces sp. NPDC047072]|uniref:TauD/TfdA family dioxygenase n=1 Tax=Streptomyces sp. NPDC047072 TaxID=3154809 RepID=UPI0033EDBA51